MRSIVINMGVALAAAGLFAAVSAGAPASTASPPPIRTATMPEFAFIFRPTRTLSADDLALRNPAARDWALARRREGLLTSASPLEDQGVRISHAGVAPLANGPQVGAVLIIKVADLDAAVALARTHPGLAFGTEIELRPVKPVGPPP